MKPELSYLLLYNSYTYLLNLFSNIPNILIIVLIEFPIFNIFRRN